MEKPDPDPYSCIANIHSSGDFTTIIIIVAAAIIALALLAFLLIRKRCNGRVLFIGKPTTLTLKGSTTVTELCRRFGVSDSYFEPLQGDATTISAMLTEMEGHLPEKGSMFEFDDFFFEITDADENAVNTIKVQRKSQKKTIGVIGIALLLAIMTACGEEERYIPKPKGYFRIDMPKKSYVSLDTIQRYSFEYPATAIVGNDIYSPEEKNWITLEFPEFKGSLHLTHKEVNGNLGEYLEDVHAMLSKHLQKANGIHDSIIINPERATYGMMIEIDGSGVATPLQFYLTDSTRNFVRGSLYFNFMPNNDSMRPVINYLREDIEHIISTFEWK